MHISRKFIVLLAALLFLATGCSRSAPSASGSSATATGDPGSSGSAGRARVVSANVTMVADCVDDAASLIRAEVEREGGWVADANLNGDGTDCSAELVVRIPAKATRSLRAALAKIGEVKSDSEHVTDVTEQRADLDARVHNARIQEKRIQEIVANRTGTLAEVLEAEKELARVRENIERLEAQKNALATQIDYATVQITLTTRTAPAWQTPGTSLKRAGAGGLRGAAAVAVYGGMAIVTVAPTLAPIALAVTALVLVIRRRNKKAAVAFAQAAG